MSNQSITDGGWESRLEKHWRQIFGPDATFDSVHFLRTKSFIESEIDKTRKEGREMILAALPEIVYENDMVGGNLHLKEFVRSLLKDTSHTV